MPVRAAARGAGGRPGRIQPRLPDAAEDPQDWSFAILPLFATELILGQSLYEDGGSSKKDAHVAVGVGIGTLFGINTVTGVWNLLESRKDPNGRKRRVIHSVLMLAADAGFVATAALAPDSEHGGGVRLARRSPRGGHHVDWPGHGGLPHDAVHQMSLLAMVNTTGLLSRVGRLVDDPLFESRDVAYHGRVRARRRTCRWWRLRHCG